MDQVERFAVLSRMVISEARSLATSPVRVFFEPPINPDSGQALILPAGSVVAATVVEPIPGGEAIVQIENAKVKLALPTPVQFGDILSLKIVAAQPDKISAEIVQVTPAPKSVDLPMPPPTPIEIEVLRSLEPSRQEELKDALHLFDGAVPTGGRLSGLALQNAQKLVIDSLKETLDSVQHSLQGTNARSNRLVETVNLVRSSNRDIQRTVNTEQDLLRSLNKLSTEIRTILDLESSRPMKLPPENPIREIPETETSSSGMKNSNAAKDIPETVRLFDSVAETKVVLRRFQTETLTGPSRRELIPPALEKLVATLSRKIDETFRRLPTDYSKSDATREVPGLLSSNNPLRIASLRELEVLIDSSTNRLTHFIVEHLSAVSAPETRLLKLVTENDNLGEFASIQKSLVVTRTILAEFPLGKSGSGSEFIKLAEQFGELFSPSDDETRVLSSKLLQSVQKLLKTFEEASKPSTVPSLQPSANTVSPEISANSIVGGRAPSRDEKLVLQLRQIETHLANLIAQDPENHETTELDFDERQLQLLRESIAQSVSTFRGAVQVQKEFQRDTQQLVEQLNLAFGAEANSSDILKEVVAKQLDKFLTTYGIDSRNRLAVDGTLTAHPASERALERRDQLLPKQLEVLAVVVQALEEFSRADGVTEQSSQTFQTFISRFSAVELRQIGSTGDGATDFQNELDAAFVKLQQLLGSETNLKGEVPIQLSRSQERSLTKLSEVIQNLSLAAQTPSEGATLPSSERRELFKLLDTVVVTKKLFQLGFSGKESLPDSSNDGGFVEQARQLQKDLSRLVGQLRSVVPTKGGLEKATLVTNASTRLDTLGLSNGNGEGLAVDIQAALAELSIRGPLFNELSSFAFKIAVSSNAPSGNVLPAPIQIALLSTIDELSELLQFLGSVTSRGGSNAGTLRKTEPEVGQKAPAVLSRASAAINGREQSESAVSLSNVDTLDRSRVRSSTESAARSGSSPTKATSSFVGSSPAGMSRPVQNMDPVLRKDSSTVVNFVPTASTFAETIGSSASPAEKIERFVTTAGRQGPPQIDVGETVVTEESTVAARALEELLTSLRSVGGDRRVRSAPVDKDITQIAKQVMQFAKDRGGLSQGARGAIGEVLDQIPHTNGLTDALRQMVRGIESNVKLIEQLDRLVRGQEVLRQLNPVMESFGEPTFVLFPAILNGLLLKMELTLYGGDKKSVEKESGELAGEARAKRTEEGAEGDDSEARNRSRRNPNRFQFSITLPNLGEVGVDFVDTLEGALLRFLLPEVAISEFVDRSLPDLRDAFLIAGIPLQDVVLVTAVPPSVRPEWVKRIAGVEHVIL